VSTSHRSPGDIERDIEATRERLAGTIDEISERVKPSNVVNDLKEKARAQVVDEHGAVRIQRVAAAGAAAASAVGLAVLKRVRRHH